MPRSERHSAGRETHDHVQTTGYTRVFAYLPDGIEFGLARPLVVDDLGRHEYAASTPFQAGPEFARSFFGIAPVDESYGYDPVRGRREEILLPAIVGAAIGVRKFAVSLGERENSDGGKEHAIVDRPLVEQSYAGGRIEACSFATVRVAKPSSEQLQWFAVRASQTGQDSLKYAFLANDQVLNAVAALDAYGTVAKFCFEISLPEIGWFENVRVAVDDHRARVALAAIITGSGRCHMNQPASEHEREPDFRDQLRQRSDAHRVET